jgi:hypothetical protein
LTQPFGDILTDRSEFRRQFLDRFALDSLFDRRPKRIHEGFGPFQGVLIGEIEARNNSIPDDVEPGLERVFHGAAVGYVPPENITRRFLREQQLLGF